MLNSKGSIYILMILALSIWGYIIFKVFINKDQNKLYNEVITKNKNTQILGSRDFNLIENYPNPFKNYSPNRVMQSSTSVLDRKSKSIVKKQPTVSISLNGIVINNHHRTAHVSMGSQYYIVTVGDTVANSVIIKKIELDSILIRTEGKFKWIKKN